MSDRADHRALEAALGMTPDPACEAARRRFAAARIHALEQIERRLLDLAVKASEDSAARWLELWADTAWRDAAALRSEHAHDARQEVV